MDFIPVYKPYLTKNNLRYAHDALDSTWISSRGKYLELVEEYLKTILNTKYVLLTNTGTAAMHLVAKALKYSNFNIRNLVVPNNVYVAAWNSFLFDPGNFKLNNLDTNLETWNLDLNLLEKHIYEADAVLIVHNLGNVINVPYLKEKFPSLVFVEDACEALGGIYDDQMAGTASLCSGLSFFGNKNFTSGEGGAFVTDREDLYEYAKLIHGQGQSKKKFIHDTLGYNYRMTNIEAAILYGQLNDWSKIMDMKKEVFYQYDEQLKSIELEKINTQKEQGGTKPSYWLYGVRILGNPDYDNAETFFLRNGIETRPLFYPINSHYHLKGHWKCNDNAKLLSKEVIVFPSYPELTKQEILYITDKIKEYVRMVDLL